MSDVICPVCESTECTVYEPEDGDYLCDNPGCQAKFLWPQPERPVELALSGATVEALRVLRDEGVIPNG